MSTYRVDVNFQGIASVIIDAKDNEDACEKAEIILSGACIPGINLEEAKLSLEIDSAQSQLAEEWDEAGHSW